MMVAGRKEGRSQGGRGKATRLHVTCDWGTLGETQAGRDHALTLRSTKYFVTSQLDFGQSAECEGGSWKAQRETGPTLAGSCDHSKLQERRTVAALGWGDAGRMGNVSRWEQLATAEKWQLPVHLCTCSSSALVPHRWTKCTKKKTCGRDRGTKAGTTEKDGRSTTEYEYRVPRAVSLVQ